MDLSMNSDGVRIESGRLSLTDGRGAALAQRLRIRLRTFYQSWFLDEEFGVDYFGRVFEKGIPKSSIDSMFQSEILKDFRVKKILDFSSRIEGNQYKLEFKAKAKNGLISDVVSFGITPNGITVEI